MPAKDHNQSRKRTSPNSPGKATHSTKKSRKVTRAELVGFYQRHKPENVEFVDDILGRFDSGFLHKTLTELYGESPIGFLDDARRPTTSSDVPAPMPESTAENTVEESSSSSDASAAGNGKSGTKKRKLSGYNVFCSEYMNYLKGDYDADAKNKMIRRKRMQKLADAYAEGKKQSTTNPPFSYENAHELRKIRDNMAPDENRLTVAATIWRELSDFYKQRWNAYASDSASESMSDRAAKQTTTANKPRKKKVQECTDVVLYNNLEKQPPTMLNVLVSHFGERNSDKHACVSRCANPVGILSDMESLREFLRSLKDVGDVQANAMRESLLDYLDNNEEEYFDEYKGDLTASDMASELIDLLYN